MKRKLLSTVLAVTMAVSRLTGCGQSGTNEATGAGAATTDAKTETYRVRIPIDSCDFSLAHYEADGEEADENFEHFSFDWYSDTMKNEATGLTARETAKRAYNTARNFVDDFDKRAQNLFLYGSTGVGKTFLSHCIASELLKTAHCVLYFSAFDLFDRLAQTAFSRKSETDPGDDFILDCDLLIIDDLGTELTNSFVSSQLFLCINERISRRKSTIISTNLKLEDFSATYSERTFSRIASNYQMLKLIGKDIRIQKIFLGGK